MIAAALAFACAALGTAGVGTALGAGRRAPLARRAAVAGLGRRLRASAGLEGRIAAAGRPGGLGARELMSLKVAGALAAALPGALSGAVAPGRLGLLAAVGGPVAGFLAPDLWLARRARERARLVRRELPGALDLLAVTVEAGAAIGDGIARVAARSRGPLAAEWRALGGEVTLGVPFEEALAGLGMRLPQAEVVAFCAAVARARRHGAPLGRTLAGQARDTRMALRRRVAEDAARAAPKIQVVVALLLVPSVLLLVAAALAAALLDGGGGASALGG